MVAAQVERVEEEAARVVAVVERERSKGLVKRRRKSRERVCQHLS